MRHDGDVSHFLCSRVEPLPVLLRGLELGVESLHFSLDHLGLSLTCYGFGVETLHAR